MCVCWRGGGCSAVKTEERKTGWRLGIMDLTLSDSEGGSVLCGRARAGGSATPLSLSLRYRPAGAGGILHYTAGSKALSG